MKRKITLLAVLSAAAIGVTGVTVSSKGRIANPLKAQGCLHTHVEHHDAVEPSILKAGHMEYWCCCECHQSFSDSTLQNVIENTQGNPTDPTDGRFTGAATGKMISESAMCSNGASYVKVQEAAPQGFSNVNKISVPGDRVGDSVMYSTVLVSNYEKLTFGIKSGDGTLLLDGWGKYIEDHSWVVVEIEYLGGYKYNVDYKTTSGNLIYNENFVYNESAGTGYVKGGLNNVMFKCATYASAATDSFYVTELVGSKRAVTGTIIDESAYSANGVSHSLIAGDVANGFEKISEISVAGSDYTHGQFFSAVPLKKYETVTFALKTSGFILFENWNALFDSKDNWAVFTLTNNFDDTFNLVINNMNGDTLYTRDNVPAVGAGPVYTPYALNTILYGGSLEIKPSKRDGCDFNLFASEVRGVLVSVPVVGSKIDDCAVSANGVGMSSSTMAVPGGYELVSEKKFDKEMHGQFYSALDLRPYSEVHFALKTTGTFNFDSWDKSYGGHGWMFFSLTNNGDNTFNLEVKDETDAVLCTTLNLNSYKGEETGVYTNYALNTTLYGNPAIGYYPYGTNISVYVTELRGTLAN